MRKLLLAVSILSLLGFLAGCYGGHNSSITMDSPYYEQGLVDKATSVVRSMRADPAFRHIDVYLKNARGVLILPSVIKAGLIYGGQGGNGVLLARDPDGVWSSPAFYTLGGGSIGLQIGVQEATIVLVFMNDKSFRAAIDTGLTLGADATVAAGTTGYTGEVGSTHAFKDVYYFADVGGLFAGISLEGGVIHVRDNLNKAYYGRFYTPRQILLERRADQSKAGPLKDVLGAAGRGN